MGWEREDMKMGGMGGGGDGGGGITHLAAH